MSEGSYEILDRRFARLVNTSARLDLLDSTSRWAEGPVYVPAGRCLLWSDAPNDRIMRWDEESGHVSASGRHRTTRMATHSIDRATSSPAST